MLDIDSRLRDEDSFQYDITFSPSYRNFISLWLNRLEAVHK